MKTTIYELLGMIKDGKAPKKFIYDNQLFILDEEDNVYRSHLGNRFGAMYQLDIKLNDEIEILEGTLEEEKKIPEKLDKYADVSGDLACEWTFGEKKLKDKVNEIIDYLDYLKSKGE